MDEEKRYIVIEVKDIREFPYCGAFATKEAARSYINKLIDEMLATYGSESCDYAYSEDDEDGDGHITCSIGSYEWIDWYIIDTHNL